jgi:hypothetical protein
MEATVGRKAKKNTDSSAMSEEFRRFKRLAGKLISAPKQEAKSDRHEKGERDEEQQQSKQPNER